MGQSIHHSILLRSNKSSIHCGSMVGKAKVHSPTFRANTGGQAIYPNRGKSVPQEVFIGEFTVTAYCDDIYKTSSGTIPGVGTIAVDPRVIPIGTKLYVEGYGYGIALDTGKLIKGRRLDVWINGRQNCLNFGRQKLKVWIVKE